MKIGVRTVIGMLMVVMMVIALVTEMNIGEGGSNSDVRDSDGYGVIDAVMVMGET